MRFWRIRRPRRGLCAVAISAWLVASQTGCVALVIGGAAAVAAVGTVVYLEGELKSTEGVSLDQAWEATQQAVEELEFTVTRSDKDAVSAHLGARTAGDKVITVKLRREGDNLTTIGIRVGTFGDEALSRHILKKIREHW